MKAEDTVMSPEMKVDILKDCRHRGETMLPKLIINLTEAQAKISFKAGKKEMVKWGSEPCVGHQRGIFKHQCHLCWQAKLKEWGLDAKKEARE